MTGTGWPTLNTGDIIEAEHVTKAYGALNGTANYGEQIILTDFSSASLYSLKVFNPGSGGKAVQIRNSANDANLLLVEDSGVVFLGSPIRPEVYGAAADGTTDDATAIQAALDAAKAAGGGDVELDTRKGYRSASRLTIGRNVRLRHNGVQEHNVNPKNTLLIGTSGQAFSLPAIVLGADGSTASAGSFGAVEDITIEMLGTATAASYEGGTVSALICIDRLGGSSGATGTRAFIRRVKAVGAIDLVQAGTTNTQYSVGQLVMKGGDYLYFRRNDVEGAGGTTAVVRLNGSSANQPDGGEISGNFCEDFGFGIVFNNTAGSIANLNIGPGNTFDGVVVYGVWVHPATSGTCQLNVIFDNQINGTGVAGNIGIVLDQDNNADIHSNTIRDNRISLMGQQGILINTPTAAADIRNTLIEGNRILGCGSLTTNTYAGIDIESGVEEVQVLRNTIERIGAGNVVSYGVRLAGSNAKFAVIGNTALDAGTAAVSKGSSGNGTTAIYQDNYGPVAAGDATPGPRVLLGVWHATNPGAGTAAFDIGQPGCDGNLFVQAPYAMRVTEISLTAVNNAGAGTAIASAANRTATATVSKNGNAGTLATTFTPDGALFGSSNKQDTGDTYAVNDLIGVELATGASWVAGDDVTVRVWGIPT
jgi:hypothetical protein